MSIRILSRAAIALLALAAACNRSDETSTAGVPQPVEFDAFVLDLVQNQTSETGEPQQVNGVSFAFDEDETAFDALFE